MRLKLRIAVENLKTWCQISRAGLLMPMPLNPNPHNPGPGKAPPDARAAGLAVPLPASRQPLCARDRPPWGGHPQPGPAGVAAGGGRAHAGPADAGWAER